MYNKGGNSMTWKKIMLIIIFYIIFVPLNINAEEKCNLDELNKLKNTANLSEIKYKYIKDFVATEEEEQYGPIIEPKNRFLISINNLSEDYYIVSIADGFYITYDKSREVPNVQNIRSYVGGSNLVFDFYASENSNCPNVKLKSSYVKLPKYNIYSENKLCNGIEDFYLCNKWYSGNIIDEKSFISDTNEYIKSLDKIKTPTKDKQTIIDYIIDNVTTNYMMILIIIIIFGVSSITLIKYYEKRSSKL
jgi:hypothetical protein